VGATPEEALPCLGSVRAPTARGGGPALGPLEVLAPETVTRLNWQNLKTSPLVHIGRDEVRPRPRLRPPALFPLFSPLGIPPSDTSCCVRVTHLREPVIVARGVDGSYVRLALL